LQPDFLRLVFTASVDRCVSCGLLRKKSASLAEKILCVLRTSAEKNYVSSELLGKKYCVPCELLRIKITSLANFCGKKLCLANFCGKMLRHLQTSAEKNARLANFRGKKLQLHE
jgi:hypothetical protein